MSENLIDGEIELKPIVFHDHSPKISVEAFLAVCHALNKPRPFCSKDSVPQYFIIPMHGRVHGA